MVECVHQNPFPYNTHSKPWKEMDGVQNKKYSNFHASHFVISKCSS